VNGPPASIGAPVDSVDTPALLVDLDALDENIRRMAKAASTHGVRLRPHAKTHKSPLIALKQMAHGAVGVCCQKVGEAEVMAWGGVKDILISNEIWGRSKLERIAALAREVKIAVCVDDALNAEDLSAAAVAYGVNLDVLVDINVIGDFRTGVQPGDAALRLAGKVDGFRGLSFAGLHAYAGKAQHIRDFPTRESVIKKAIDLAATTRSLLEREGLSCQWITGSGTGTYQLEAASGVYTELQAGSYIFMDADYGQNLAADGGPYRDFEHSLFVYSTIMSRPTADSAILDAGLKASSFDSGPPVIRGLPQAEWVGGGDEHFNVRTPGSAFPYALGDKVKLIPGHCDPTVNMYDWYVGFRNERVEAIWPVAARGFNR
jgi:3-hydroxy-D-aspartate aldolase